MPGQDPDSLFTSVGKAARIWAVGAVEGHAGALDALHRRLADSFEPGDRLVYLGNVLGRGPGSAAAVDMALRMRRHALAHRAAAANDVVFLRGGREEMMDRFLHLHMAMEPLEVFEWMCGQGFGSILSAYGLNADEGRRCRAKGAREIAGFLKATRGAMASRDGHRDYFLSLRRAAFDEGRNVLFVSAGLDPRRPLDTQVDELWWGAEGFDSFDAPFGTFRRVVRGADPRRRGVVLGRHVLTLDPGETECVHAALIGADGSVLDTLSSSP